MSTFAIIPVKRLGEAKSSFRNFLTDEQRKQLVLSMLSDVLNSVKGVGLKTLVVSPDDEVLAFVKGPGIDFVREPGLDLNRALGIGIRAALGFGATGALVLPADIPFLKPLDIQRMMELAPFPRGVVISPSKTGGTNALLLRPPDIIDLEFGGESYSKHVEGCLRRGVAVKTYTSERVAVDVDEPADLLHAETLGLGTRTHEFLSRLK